MNQTQKRNLITVAALTLLAAGCTKKPVAVAPPPAAAPFDFEAGTAAGAYRHYAASRVYDTSAAVSECGHSCTD